MRVAPRDEQVLLALANYSAELGDKDKARGYARQLVDMNPRNPNYQQLLQEFSDSQSNR